jgi:hypothetical protein
MKIEGGCHCGAIAYEAEVDPEGSRVCHCTDCQTIGGSAFRQVVPTVPGAFTVTKGEPKIYVKIAESGNPRVQAFCGDCGTHIYASNVGEAAKVYNVRTGTSKQRTELAPRFHIWHRSAQPWVSTMDSLKKYEKGQI